MAKIYGNTVGASGLPKSYVLETEDGAQLIGVLVGEETVLTATDNDVRENLIYAGDKGLSTGTKVIPSYNTTEASKLIMPGKEFALQLHNLSLYDYTKLMAIICPFNKSLSTSVAADKTVINNFVYSVGSAEAISPVIKDDENKIISFGITNNTDTIYVLRYFTYKEIY